MQNQEQETERKYRLISGTSTTVFFILLSLLLWFIKFSKPEKDEIPEELSVAVALEEGASGGGGGSEGGPSEEVPVDVSSPSVPQMSLPSQSTEQTSDATAVPVRKTNPSPNTTPEISEEQRILNEMIARKKGQTKPSGGGNGPDFGDGGSGGGNDGGNGPGNGPGKGPGSGPGPGGNGYGLEGFGTRGLNGYRKAPDNCNKAGTIKLTIKVRGDGAIIDMDPVEGYDYDICLVERAKACLRNAKFDASSDTKLVTGVITIKFTQQ